MPLSADRAARAVHRPSGGRRRGARPHRAPRAVDPGRGGARDRARGARRPSCARAGTRPPSGCCATSPRRSRGAGAREPCAPCPDRARPPAARARPRRRAQRVFADAPGRRRRRARSRQRGSRPRSGRWRRSPTRATSTARRRAREDARPRRCRPAIAHGPKLLRAAGVLARRCRQCRRATSRTRCRTTTPSWRAWIEATAVRVLLAAPPSLRRRPPAGRGARLCLADTGDPHALAILETARLRVLCEAGDLDASAACLEMVARHARAARTPLQLPRARLVWQGLLRRCGREREADTVVRRLRRTAAGRRRRCCGGRSAGCPCTGPRAGRAPPCRGPSSPRRCWFRSWPGRVVRLDDLRGAIARAAAAPFAVLIEGESGVGKELVARAIHRLSPRAQRRFCDVNCAAFPDELVEAELFGHARGAFTGAAAIGRGCSRRRAAARSFSTRCRSCRSRAQAKLLRVLQQQEVRRLGETASRPVDVRVVAAANRRWPSEVAAGRFRDRSVVPARRRSACACRRFASGRRTCRRWRSSSGERPRRGWARRATLGDWVLRALPRYAWPGNVRELQNVLAALAVAAPSARARAGALLPARLLEAHRTAYAGRSPSALRT